MFEHDYDEPLRLNLACGTDIRDGWCNLDVVKKWPMARRECDQIWDARKDKIPFPDGSVDEIYAGYLFLHLAPIHHSRVLTDIRRVLRMGGSLMVGEVDMAILLPRWLANPSDPYLSGLVWGEQGELMVPLEEQRALADFDKHCQGFTEKTLANFLLSHGFKNIHRTKIHGEAVFYELTLVTRKE